MARVYQIQGDNRYNKAPVVQNKALVYLAYPNGNLSIRAKLHDGSVVTLASQRGSGTPSDSSNYYTKTQVDFFINQIQASLHQNYYTKAQINDLVAGSSYQNFDVVVDNKVNLSQKIPVGVKTVNGNYYPVQKGSVEFNSNSTVSLDVSRYIAYDGSDSFHGEWTVYFSQGYNESGPTTQFNNYYVVSQLPSSDNLSQYPDGSFFILE